MENRDWDFQNACAFKRLSKPVTFFLEQFGEKTHKTFTWSNSTMKLKHGTPCYSFEDNGLRSVEINTRRQVLDSPILKGFLIICGALHGLVRFVQFKKREKHPWRSVTLNKVALFHGCFSRFLNCANGTKSRNTSHYN